MFNNISLELEKKYLTNALNYFNTDDENDKRIYKILEDCIKEDMKEKQILEKLNTIGDLKEYPQNVQAFFNSRIYELNLLIKNEEEKAKLTEKIQEKNENIEEDLSKRNVDYNENFDKYQKELDNSDLTYLDGKKDKEELEKDLERVNKIEDNITKERQSGEQFDDEMKYNSNSDYLKNTQFDNKMSMINENAINNIELKPNASLEVVKAYYNDFVNHEREESKLHIDFEFKGDDAVDLKLSYKGNMIDESKPLTVFSYSGEKQMNDFYKKDGVYDFITQELGETDTKFNVSEEKAEGENLHGETVDIYGSDNQINDVEQKVERERKNLRGKALVREDLNKKGFNNKGIYIILLFSLIVVVLLIIYLLIFK